MITSLWLLQFLRQDPLRTKNYPKLTVSVISIESTMKLDEVSINDLNGCMQALISEPQSRPCINTEMFPGGPYLVQVVYDVNVTSREVMITAQSP